MAHHSIVAPAAAGLLAALASAACGSPVGGAGGSTAVSGASSTSVASSTTVPTSTATDSPTSNDTPTRDTPTSSRRTTSDPDPGPTAPGSPIDVPTIPDPHTSMSGLRENITSLFEQACQVGPGEPLCVTLVFTDGDCFVGYDPSTTAARGSTVTVVTESQEECDAANQPTDTTTTTKPTGDTSGTGGGTTESTSVAPDQGQSQNQTQHQSQGGPGDVGAASRAGGV